MVSDTCAFCDGTHDVRPYVLFGVGEPGGEHPTCISCRGIIFEKRIHGFKGVRKRYGSVTGLPIPLDETAEPDPAPRTDDSEPTDDHPTSEESGGSNDPMAW